MGIAQSEKELAERAARFLKAELKRANVTYEELARRLKDHGLEETRDFDRGEAQARNVCRDVSFSITGCHRTGRVEIRGYLTDIRAYQSVLRYCWIFCNALDENGLRGINLDA